MVKAAVQNEQTPAHYSGHRARLRTKFLENGPMALADYELLELLLFGTIPQGDVKPLAKDLIARFGGFGKVLAADPFELAKVKGVGDVTIANLKAIRAAGELLLREEAKELPVLGSWRALLDYCRAAMRHAKIEEFRVLFLNNKNMLIADEVQQRGTIDHTPVYPREVVKRALELGAAAIILVHNHPSGDPSPSKADIAVTRQIIDAAKALGVAVHDHVIIGDKDHYSFKSNGLI